MRTLSRIVIAGLWGAGAFVANAREARAAAAQPDRPLLQLEVGDSVGLPLPDARLELFTYAEGGIFREWLTIVPAMLGPGVHLLRFSHQGYEPAVFSVPLRKEAPVSLRVRLRTSSPKPPGGGAAEAVSVNAIGLALTGRTSSDIIGARRVLDRDAIERTNAEGVADIFRIRSMRRSIGADDGVGDWGVRLRNPRTGDRCVPALLLNGDLTLTLTLARYQELYRLSEPEAVEFVLDGKAIPYTFRQYNPNCPVMLIWLRGR